MTIKPEPVASKYPPELLDSAFQWARAHAEYEEHDAIAGKMTEDRAGHLAVQACEGLSRAIIVRSNLILADGVTSHLRSIALYGVAAIMDRKDANFESVKRYLTHDVFAPKNVDYGDAFALCGVPGICVRILDKWQRIKKLSQANYSPKVIESIDDTLQDMTTYAGMALMLILAQVRE